MLPLGNAGKAALGSANAVGVAANPVPVFTYTCHLSLPTDGSAQLKNLTMSGLPSPVRSVTAYDGVTAGVQ